MIRDQVVMTFLFNLFENLSLSYLIITNPPQKELERG